MSSFVAYTIFGLFSGAAYAIAASGLVLTYTTTRVFNVAHGAFGMLLAFVFWDFSVRQGMPAWLALVLVLFVVAPADRLVPPAVRDPGARRGTGQRLAGGDRRAAGASASAPRSRSSPTPRPRSVLPFFPETSFAVGDATVTAHQLITVLASVAGRRSASTCCSTAPASAPRCGPRSTTPTCSSCSAASPTGWPRWRGRSASSLAGARRHPARLEPWGWTTSTHAAGHQRVRRGDARPAAEPAADVRRRDRPRSVHLLHHRLPPAEGAARPGRNVVPALFLFAVIVAMPQAQLRVGQVKGIVSAPLPSPPKALGWGGGLLVLVALLAGSLSTGQPAAGRHRGDVRDGDALAGAAHRVRRPRLAGPVHLRRGRCAGLRQARRAEPLRAGALGAGRGRRWRAGGAAGAAAHRALPGAGHARVRHDHGQDGLPGRLRVRVQRHAGRRAALDARSSVGLHRRLRLRDGGLLGGHGNAAAGAPARCGRADADRDARQPGGVRHPRPGPALVPGRPVRGVGGDGRAGRRAVRRAARDHRRRGLPVLQQPACCCCSRWSSGSPRSRARCSAGSAHDAAGAAERPPVDRGAVLRRHGRRCGHARTRPERPGQPAVQARRLAPAADRAADPRQAAGAAGSGWRGVTSVRSSRRAGRRHPVTARNQGGARACHYTLSASTTSSCSSAA